MFGRDRDKIRILGDIIEPIGVMWKVEKGKTWETAAPLLVSTE